jgi:hypothetical protein
LFNIRANGPEKQVPFFEDFAHKPPPPLRPGEKADRIPEGMSDLLRHFLTALGLQESGPLPLSVVTSPHRPLSPPTNRSTTIFSGEADEWLDYLGRPWNARQDADFEMEIRVEPESAHVEFLPRNERSVAWAKALTRAFAEISSRLEKMPGASRVYHEMIFSNSSNMATGIALVSSHHLPASSTREMRVDDDLSPSETRILLRTELFREFEPVAEESDRSPGHLGKIWEVVRYILLELGHTSYPRDRFTERIQLTTNWVLINLRILYEGKRDGRLVPNEAGEAFEKARAARAKIDRRDLSTRDPFFRLLSDLSFLLRDRNLDSLRDTAAVIVRDFLDSRYLRLSIAGLMPARPEWLEAMPVEWNGSRKIKTPPPEIGRYGVIDEEDRDAWKKVRGPLEEIGYLIIGQLGMGQFGRVYEAINVANGSIPTRVAVKVDRIRKGHKKEAIEAADTIMGIARGLAKSPHVIRVFDAGFLKKIRSNYHILQIVEGDTLDHLIGIAGTEHASVLRPSSGRSSQEVTRSEFMKSLSGSASEAWRKNRKSPPFVAPPGLGHILDLLTSTALWLEEVHGLGYAVNDLKNGNIMLSRRGQFKAIDLDAYSPIFSALDKLPDFFFLAVSSLQLITRGCAWDGSTTSSAIKELLADAGAVERRLLEIWPYGDLLIQSRGRVATADITSFFALFIDDARSGKFAEDPTRFTAAIDNLIYLKRSLSTEEMVLQ